MVIIGTQSDLLERWPGGLECPVRGNFTNLKRSVSKCWSWIRCYRCSKLSTICGLDQSMSSTLDSSDQSCCAVAAKKRSTRRINFFSSKQKLFQFMTRKKLCTGGNRLWAEKSVWRCCLLASKIPAVVIDHKVAQKWAPDPSSRLVPPASHSHPSNMCSITAVLQPTLCKSANIHPLSWKMQEDFASMLKELWNKRK